jgi:mono/diheme cytochrome c family protein
MQRRLRHLLAGLSLAAGLAGTLACSSSSSDTTTADPGTPAQQGAALVARNTCADCHGAGLSGSDTAQPGTKAYGPNLTPDQDTGVGSWSDAQIAAAIRIGVDDEGATLCNVMPHFGGLSDTETAAIVAYLRSLAPVAHPTPETDCGGDAGK